MNAQHLADTPVSAGAVGTGAPQQSRGLSRRACIYPLLAFMAAGAITAVLRALLGDLGPAPLVTVAALTALILIPLGLKRGFRQLRLASKWHRLGLLVVFVCLCLLSVGLGFYNSYGLTGGTWLNTLLAEAQLATLVLNQATALALTGLCWGLGLWLADLALTSANLVRFFYAGAALLVALAVFFVYDLSQDLPWLLYALLFGGLVALGLGRVEEVDRRSNNRDVSLTPYWLTRLGLLAGAVLLVSSVVLRLGLFNVAGALVALVQLVLAVLIFGPVYLGVRGLVLALTLVGRFAAAEALEEAELPPPPGGFDPGSAGNLCASLIVVAVLLSVLLLLVTAILRWRQMLKDTADKERAATPTPGDVLAQVLEEQLERAANWLPGLKGLRRRLAAHSIRRIYAAMVALAGERGRTRPPTFTPYEYLGELRRAFPGCETQAEQITEAYVAAHYGQAPETRAALQAIRAAWELMRRS